MQFLRTYISIINKIFGTVYSGFSNEGGWIGEAIAAGGAVLGAVLSGGGGSNNASTGKVENSTVTTTNIADKDVLYRDQAIASMDKFAEQLAQFGANDRAFMENVYQPFQNALMQTNQSLLPMIERVAGATLEANAKDLLGNDALKNTLRNRAGGTNADAEAAMNNLRSQIDNLPSTEERVGQAMASVEGQFKGAGKELARAYQSRGQTVSQSSRRDLAFEKARAKSGAAGLAAEQSRAEHMGAAQMGVNAELAKQQSDATTSATNINSLASLQNAQQAGLATPQVGGVTQTNGLDAANIQAGVTTAAGLQTFGGRSKDDNVVQTQKGLNMPNITSGATGQKPTAGLFQPLGTPKPLNPQ